MRCFDLPLSMNDMALGDALSGRSGRIGSAARGEAPADGHAVPATAVRFLEPLWWLLLLRALNVVDVSADFRWKTC